MDIAILGTGSVGRTLGSKLVSLGHRVRMGAREAGNEKAAAWAAEAGTNASAGTFADAAVFGEMVFNCTPGNHAVAVLAAAGAANLDGKILVDVSNPLDFSRGMPPSLTVCNTDSIGETLQRTFPGVRVVKALNTMNCQVMVDPGRLAADTAVFVAGNDAEARALVGFFLREQFGWKTVIDLGDITASRGLEMWLPLWVRLMGPMGTAVFNLALVKAG
jgi:predicted dinucleotide-binding enzyme